MPKLLESHHFARQGILFSPAHGDNHCGRHRRLRRDDRCDVQRHWHRVALARHGQPLAIRGGRRSWLAPERFPKDTGPHRSQQTNLHGAEAAGSCGRAGRGPTPPSATAAP